MLQPSLFDQQKENLSRVYSRLEPTILEFVKWRAAPENAGYFSMTMLTEFVRAKYPHIAPDSPGRILRQLRQAGRVNYRIENRRASLYRILPTL